MILLCRHLLERLVMDDLIRWGPSIYELVIVLLLVSGLWLFDHRR